MVFLKKFISSNRIVKCNIVQQYLSIFEIIMKDLIKKYVILFVAIIWGFTSEGQLFFRSTLKTNRDKLYQNLVNNSIHKNLSVTLSDSTEEDWQGAFYALELIRYQSPWVNSRIDSAALMMNTLSVSFQRAALEMLYSNYPEKYYQQVKYLLMGTSDAKIFAMCAAYILNSSKANEDLSFLKVKTQQQLALQPNHPILEQLQFQLQTHAQSLNVPDISLLLQADYLKGHNIVFSFQRKNRNFPGLVLVRKGDGTFIRDSSSGLPFTVPQLARSINNLPGYITNGNTPEGIFRMKGYDVSTNGFIGPTANVQLTMPFEKSAGHFTADENNKDTVWDIRYYKNLLPAPLQNYYPLLQSYYAGKAGRTEIIIHGTTVNPAYYRQQPYYPLTPTMGCLTSKEIWDETTGRRAESDQQKIIQALIAAGGADGYTIVVNMDDEQRSVLLADMLPLLTKAGQK